MNIVMYAHGGSENHGCEAIIRSTDLLLQEDEMLLSYDKQQDIKYGIDQKVQVKQALYPIKKQSVDFIIAFLRQKLIADYHLMDSLAHKLAIKELPDMDAALFVGGDNYCYSDVKNYAYINRYMRKKARKLVLWGISVEPELLDDRDIRNDIQKFDLIVARESISYNALKKVNSKTILLPDPAFFLQAEEVEVPAVFEQNSVVGINVSPLVMRLEGEKGVLLSNYEDLIEHILEHTAYSIALVPHVVWQNNDDREPLKMLYNKYKNSGRIVFIEDHNCMQQKYIISKCRFFVGARTHATIAAYSTGIPTLVVGYSVKARGIARDLFGTEEGYVLSAQDLRENDCLTKAFCWLEKQEDELKRILQEKSKECISVKKCYREEIENAVREKK